MFAIILCKGEWQMVKPDILIRTNRRSLSLSISKTGELVVRAPKKLSMQYILTFIKEKEKWIDQKQKEILANTINNKQYLSYEYFLFCGKKYKRVEQKGIRKIELTDTEFIVPAVRDSSKMLILVQNWYIDNAKEILKNRVEYFASLMQLNYSKIVIMNNKRRWGACSQNGVLKFNYRICMLPHKVIDYIIIHELTHLIEFNHSPNFYKIIESIMPDYKKYKNDLKKYDFVLTLLR